jgi:hypothetical protein
VSSMISAQDFTSWIRPALSPALPMAPTASPPM